MDVLLDVGRQVEVDDVLDVRDVETAGGNGRGDEDRGPSTAELPQGLLALTLRAVTVDGSNRVVFGSQERLERVRALLRLDEHERQRFSGW